MKNFYFSICLLFSALAFAQNRQDYTSIDNAIAAIPNNSTYSTKSIANYIEANFDNDWDKIRAIFYWTASNISYDTSSNLPTTSKETVENSIKNTLRTRRGVCTNYSEVFSDIANKVGIHTVLVSGYTKQNGAISKNSHAWCASKINNKWYLFDPTWGSGYVKNGRFYRKIDNSYFKVSPANSIATHIPFDYLWQFMNYPVSNQEFYEGKTHINKSKPYFDFEKEIARYESESEIDQLYDSAERIRKNGVTNSLIANRLKSKERNINYFEQKGTVQVLNGITNDCNQAIDLLNDFISYRNNRFSPALPDSQIKKMIENPKQKLVACQNALYKLSSVGNEHSSSLANLKRSVSSALAKTEEHYRFVQNYISTNNIDRKHLFFKKNWY